MGKDVRNIIIAALLINFSLFFTKVVIDASNVVAVGFYRSITSANVMTIKGKTEPSISAGYARLLGIQSWHDAKVLENLGKNDDATQIFIIGALSSVFFLITAVVLLVSAIMFVARFIILIFLMILSPLAVIAYIIPGQSDKFTKWKSALISQAFFAPLFFALTWVAFKLAVGLNIAGKINITQNQAFVDLVNEPRSAIGLVLNYVIVMGFAIAALVFSKRMASSTPYFGTISGGIGAGVAGGVALAGRQTFGRAASRAEKSAAFQRWAGRSRVGNVLYSGTQKAARSSYHVGASETLKKIPGLGKEMNILGTPKRGTGGFEEYRTKKTAKVTEKGRQFTDRQARVNYARRIASKIYARRGSTPNNVNSLFGMMGRSDRIAAATLLDERIRELRTEMNTARGELNTLNNQMGFTPNAGAYVGIYAAPAAMVRTLTPAEQARYNILTGPATTNGSLANMSMEMQNLNDPATGIRTQLGLDNTLRQQF